MLMKKHELEKGCQSKTKTHLAVSEYLNSKTKSRGDGLSIEQSYSSEKLSIDNLSRENQPVVLGENSLKFGMIRSQLHILET